MSQPVIFQRVEGAAILVLSIFAYSSNNYSWLLFFILLLAPDIFAVGYLAGPRKGALAYNVGHSLVGPIVLLLVGHIFRLEPLSIELGLIWLSHIGLDRMLGYGLKETSGFSHTHLGAIGKNR